LLKAADGETPLEASISSVPSVIAAKSRQERWQLGAALWMIKRMVVDGWYGNRVSTEATALGLTSLAVDTFAMDYAASHKR
jgi:hypothetical protein